MKFFYLTLFLTFICSCTNETKQFSNHFHLECSGEHISGSKFVEDSEELSNANCRSKNYSRTGDYGFKLNSKQQFGPTYKLKEMIRQEVKALKFFFEMN